MTRVLIVDDESDVRLVARVVLSSAGYEIGEAPDGVTALAEVDRGGVDVMLLDVRMPGMSGWDVLRRLRESDTDLPVVVFTADHAAAEEAPLEMADGELFIAKPFHPDELISIVQRAVARN